MNVAIAAVSAPMQMNGVSRHALNLVGALLQNASIANIHFIVGHWQKEMFGRACSRFDQRFHAHFVSAGAANLDRLRWYYWELPHVAAQLDADVLHFACPAPVQAAAFRCPTVVSLHDLYPFDIPENFGRFSSSVTRRIMAQCIRRVDGIACVSETTRSRLDWWFPSEAKKAVTIPNVVEPSPCTPLDRLKMIPEGRAFILCVAQHRSNKNIALAIRVFDRILRKRIIPSAAYLLVVGISGPETGKIRALIRDLHLDHNVLLVNGLDDAELQWCYQHCRLLLAPSSIEGFGLPVAEALLCGCPVVCADIEAFREIGGGACRFVEFGDRVIDEYGEAIREVLARPRPVPATMPHFSSRVIGQKYAAFYERLGCCGTSDFCYATATRS